MAALEEKAGDMMSVVVQEQIPLHPQPRNGPPFQLNGSDPRDWFNENLGFRRGRLPMLFSWRCPFGIDGEPKKIDGVWCWIYKQCAQQEEN